MIRLSFPSVLPAAALALSVLWSSHSACAHDMSAPGDAGQAHPHHGVLSREPPPPFVASTDRPFDALMGDAMAVMDDAMRRAPMNGNPGHDFVTMMIPHHQGAIDMAKAILLYSQDTALRNIALGIIAEQQNEINVMRAWLRQRHAVPSAAGPTTN